MSEVILGVCYVEHPPSERSTVQVKEPMIPATDRTTNTLSESAFCRIIMVPDIFICRACRGLLLVGGCMHSALSVHVLRT